MQSMPHPITSATAADVRIVRATERERPHVLGVLAELLPGANVELRHQWLYERNPHGRSVTVIAYHRPTGEPVGIASAFPRRVSVRGAPHSGASTGDAYVKPAWRRRGIGRALWAELSARMRDDGLEFVFGTLSPAGRRIVVTEHARTVTQLRRYTRPAPIQRAFCASARLVRAAPSLSPMAGRDPRIDRVWERMAGSTAILAVRDAAHYSWRYGQAPAHVQATHVLLDGAEPVAVCVLERRGAQAAIVDLLAPPDRLVACIRAAADACGVGAVSIRLNHRSVGVELLWQAGFAPRETRPFLVLSVAPSIDRNLFAGADWYASWGDGDLDQVL